MFMDFYLGQRSADVQYCQLFVSLLLPLEGSNVKFFKHGSVSVWHLMHRFFSLLFVFHIF